MPPVADRTSGVKEACSTSHPLFVLALLLQLMFSVARCQAGVSVGGGMRVEDSDIEEGAFKAATPEAVGCNIKSSTVRRYSSEHLAIDGLKVWLNADVVAE